MYSHHKNSYVFKKWLQIFWLFLFLGSCQSLKDSSVVSIGLLTQSHFYQNNAIASVELAVESYNQYLKSKAIPLKYELKYLYLDDIPAQVLDSEISIFTKNLSFLISPIGSLQTLAIGSYVMSSATPMIFPVGNITRLYEVYPNIITYAPDVLIEFQNVGRYLTQKLNKRKIGILYTENTLQDYKNLQAELVRNGIEEVVSIYVKSRQGTSNIESYYEDIQDLANYDIDSLVLLADDGNIANLWLQALDRLSLSVPIVGGSILSDTETLLKDIKTLKSEIYSIQASVPFFAQSKKDILQNLFKKVSSNPYSKVASFVQKGIYTSESFLANVNYVSINFFDATTQMLNADTKYQLEYRKLKNKEERKEFSRLKQKYLIENLNKLDNDLFLIDSQVYPFSATGVRQSKMNVLRIDRQKRTTTLELDN